MRSYQRKVLQAGPERHKSQAAPISTSHSPFTSEFKVRFRPNTSWELLQNELKIEIIFHIAQEILPLLSRKLPSRKPPQPTTVHWRKEGMSSLLLKPTRNAPTSGLATPPAAQTAPLRQLETSSFLTFLKSLLQSQLSEVFYWPPYLKFQFLLLTFHVPFHALFFLLSIDQYLIYYILFICCIYCLSQPSEHKLYEGRNFSVLFMLWT